VEGPDFIHLVDGPHVTVGRAIRIIVYIYDIYIYVVAGTI
jgi:hypothetical protein